MIISAFISNDEKFYEYILGCQEPINTIIIKLNDFNAERVINIFKMRKIESRDTINIYSCNNNCKKYLYILSKDNEDINDFKHIAIQIVKEFWNDN